MNGKRRRHNELLLSYGLNEGRVMQCVYYACVFAMYVIGLLSYGRWNRYKSKKKKKENVLKLIFRTGHFNRPPELFALCFVVDSFDWHFIFLAPVDCDQMKEIQLFNEKTDKTNYLKKAFKIRLHTYQATLIRGSK